MPTDEKYFRDLLKNSNIQAFLLMIRKGEGTLDKDGYYRHYGGGLIESLETRPKHQVYDGKPRSSAVGAYQFLNSDHRPYWDRVANKFGWKDFLPVHQDIGALFLISERRHAIDDILNGDILSAINKTKGIWASLPGSDYGQQTQKLNNALLFYKQMGGRVGAPGQRASYAGFLATAVVKAKSKNTQTTAVYAKDLIHKKDSATLIKRKDGLESFQQKVQKYVAYTEEPPNPFMPAQRYKPRLAVNSGKSLIEKSATEIAQEIKTRAKYEPVLPNGYRIAETVLSLKELAVAAGKSANQMGSYIFPHGNEKVAFSKQLTVPQVVTGFPIKRNRFNAGFLLDNLQKTNSITTTARPKQLFTVASLFSNLPGEENLPNRNMAATEQGADISPTNSTTDNRLRPHRAEMLPGRTKREASGKPAKPTIINMNKPLVENLTIIAKGTNAAIDEFKQKIEQALLEILNSAGVAH